MTAHFSLLRLSQWIFIACAIWLIGLGGYFLFVRPPLLPEDIRYLDLNEGQVAVLLPHLTSWLTKVFKVLGGIMAGCGVLILYVSLCAIPRGIRGTGMTLGCVGLLTVATMRRINFALQSDFKWLLLTVTLVWQLGLGVLVVYFAAVRRR